MRTRLGICTLVGLESKIVEVDIGLGLPDTAIQEAKERVRAAIKYSSSYFPLERITVKLSAADIKKEGDLRPADGREHPHDLEWHRRRMSR